MVRSYLTQQILVKMGGRPKLIKIRPRKMNKLSSENKGTVRNLIINVWIITKYYNKVYVQRHLKISLWNSLFLPHHLLMISSWLLTHKQRIIIYQISLKMRFKSHQKRKRSLPFRHSLCCSILRIQKNAKKSKNKCTNNTNKRKKNKKSRRLNTKSLWWKTSKRMKKDRRPYSL